MTYGIVSFISTSDSNIYILVTSEDRLLSKIRLHSRNGCSMKGPMLCRSKIGRSASLTLALLTSRARIFKVPMNPRRNFVAGFVLSVQ
jgi:hypothetical protein